MAIYKNKKCPKCAGILMFNDNGYSVTCRDCGKQYLLSELNKTNVNNDSKESNSEEDTKHFLDKKKMWAFSPEELVNKVRYALKIKDFYSATLFNEELLKKDPKNAETYLFQLLIELKLPSKASLSRVKENFEKNENFKLIMELGNDSLKNEMLNYLNKWKQKKKEDQIKRQKARQKERREERQRELEEEKIKKKKEKQKVIFIICLSILSIIIVIFIVRGIVIYFKQHSINNLSIEITEKTDCSFEKHSYEYVYEIKIVNKGKKNINSLTGYLVFKDSSNNVLFDGSYGYPLTVKLDANETVFESYRFFIGEDEPNALALWNTDYEYLNIYFCFNYVSYEDDYYKYFSEPKEILIHSAKE